MGINAIPQRNPFNRKTKCTDWLSALRCRFHYMYTQKGLETCWCRFSATNQSVKLLNPHGGTVGLCAQRQSSNHLSQLQSLIYVRTNDPHSYINMLQGKRKPHSKYQEPAVWTAVLSWGAPVPVDSVLLLYVYCDHSNGLLANGWCISIKFTRKSSVAYINYRWNLHQKSIPTGHLLLTTSSRYKGRIWNSFEDYLLGPSWLINDSQCFRLNQMEK